MRYTYVRQHDTTDCAAACLAMVCLHYKKEITITRLRDMMGTDLKGTNLVGLQKAANELGFTTAAVRVDRENFLSDFSLPCIAQVITDQGLAHFVVIFKKTTIKDEDARRKHVRKEEERKADESKKYKCKDYVVIGDPANELKKISLDEFYKNFTGVLLLMNPTSEFNVSQRKKLAPGAPGYEAQQASEKDDGKPNRWGMMKRYIDLLLPQKKLFFYAILSSVITTILGIASSMFNKILMDEVLPYGLDNLLVTLIIVFSMVSLTSTLIGFVRQWVLIHLSIKIDIPLMLGYFGHIFHLPMKFFATRKTGDITTRYSDANTIKSIFTSIALSLVMDISMAIITGIILFRMNAMLFSISLFMALVSILLVLVYALGFRPIDTPPQTYKAPDLRQETGAMQTAVSTDRKDRLELGEYQGVDCIRTKDGLLYAAAWNGAALKKRTSDLVRTDGGSFSAILSVDGELTGFAFDADGDLWLTVLTPGGGALCRARHDSWGAAVEQVVTQIDGAPLGAVSAVEAGPDGKVYFAVAGGEAVDNGLEAALRTELLAHTGTGWVYVYDPADRSVQRVVGGVAGASGLALSPDGRTLYVSDLGNRCVWSMDAASGRWMPLPGS